MKTPNLLFALAMPAVLATAQPPADAPPPGPPPAERHGPEGDREMHRPLDRWMNQMRERHPEDHARLMNLKETDPEAFKRELSSRRDRLRDRNLEAGMAEMPRFREMMENMPPEERERMAERFSRMMRSQSKRPGPEGGKIAAGERKTRELAKAYRGAPEADRESIRAELRVQIEQIFELREAQHRRQIDEAEAHLEKLKHALTMRRKHREEIVDRRLLDLTSGEPSGRRHHVPD